MRDHMSIGSSPADEECAQLGTKDYDYAMVAKAECTLFREIIREALGPEPAGAALKIKSNPHDFGYYYDVVCDFDDNFPKAIDYAFKCENESPAKWPRWAKIQIEKFKILAKTDHERAYELRHMIGKRFAKMPLWHIIVEPISETWSVGKEE